MNPNETLVLIQTMKAKAIKKITDIPYMLPGDYKELISWPVKTAELVLFKMRYYYKISLIGDSKVCPWCIETRFNCTNCIQCKYAERHGECNKSFSDYSRITVLASSSIVGLPGVHFEIQETLKED